MTERGRKRPGYREAIAWIALNDDCEWLYADGTDTAYTASVTACLVADLFGVDTERVANDLRRIRAKWAKITIRC